MGHGMEPQRKCIIKFSLLGFTHNNETYCYAEYLSFSISISLSLYLSLYLIRLFGAHTWRLLWEKCVICLYVTNNACQI